MTCFHVWQKLILKKSNDHLGLNVWLRKQRISSITSTRLLGQCLEKTNVAKNKHLSWHGALSLHLSAVNCVRSIPLCLIYAFCMLVCNESKPPRSFCVWVSHHNTVNNLPPTFKMFSETLFVCLVAESSDEQLSKLLWIGICMITLITTTSATSSTASSITLEGKKDYNVKKKLIRLFDC